MDRGRCADVCGDRTFRLRRALGRSPVPLGNGSRQRLRWRSRIRRRGIQTSVWTGPGGASGTVGTVSTSSFTMTTWAGQKVSVDEASSTTYQKGASPTSASAITTGEDVLVLGTTSGTTITATQVIVQPIEGSGSSASSAAGVIPFQPGAPSTSKQVGQIPASYSQGSGTIVSGTTANQATEAALSAYPGGIVDRVVQLSTGEYEVHNIGVNWPHHIFVNQDFTVVGANSHRAAGGRRTVRLFAGQPHTATLRRVWPPRTAGRRTVRLFFGPSGCRGGSRRSCPRPSG